jgi:hypothetical protein
MLHSGKELCIYLALLLYNATAGDIGILGVIMQNLKPGTAAFKTDTEYCYKLQHEHANAK